MQDTQSGQAGSSTLPRWGICGVDLLKNSPLADLSGGFA